MLEKKKKWKCDAIVLFMTWLKSSFLKNAQFKTRVQKPYLNDTKMAKSETLFLIKTTEKLLSQITL